MIRLLIRIAVFLASAALGLLIAAWLLPAFHLTWEGFVIVVIIFALAQSLLTPLLARLAGRNAPTFLGGLISTFVALVVSVTVPGGLGISDWRAWILATMVIWVITSLASWILTFVFVRDNPRKTSAA